MRHIVQWCFFIDIQYWHIAHAVHISIILQSIWTIMMGGLAKCNCPRNGMYRKTAGETQSWSTIRTAHQTNVLQYCIASHCSWHCTSLQPSILTLHKHERQLESPDISMQIRVSRCRSGSQAHATWGWHWGGELTCVISWLCLWIIDLTVPRYDACAHIHADNQHVI